MNIDPTDPPPVQVTVFDERDHLGMRDGSRLKHPLVVGQEFLAAALIPDQELAIYKIVAGNFILVEKLP